MNWKYWALRQCFYRAIFNRTPMSIFFIFLSFLLILLIIHSPRKSFYSGHSLFLSFFFSLHLMSLLFTQSTTLHICDVLFCRLYAESFIWSNRCIVSCGAVKLCISYAWMHFQSEFYLLNFRQIHYIILLNILYVHIFRSRSKSWEHLSFLLYIFGFRILCLSTNEIRLARRKQQYTQKDSTSKEKRTPIQQQSLYACCNTKSLSSAKCIIITDYAHDSCTFGCQKICILHIQGHSVCVCVSALSMWKYNFSDLVAGKWL